MIIYVSVPVQLIPYRIRAVTGCSEGCVGYVGYAIRDDRDGVVVHYIDSCVPLGNLWVDRDDLDDREEQREVLGDREDLRG